MVPDTINLLTPLTFKGSVLALTSITMNSGAVLQGRLLAINGAVVLTSTNTINKPYASIFFSIGKALCNVVSSFFVVIYLKF